MAGGGTAVEYFLLALGVISLTRASLVMIMDY